MNLKILGNLKQGKKLSAKIEKSFEESKLFLLDKNITSDTELIFHYQYSTYSPDGIDFYRDEYYSRFAVSIENKPKIKDIKFNVVNCCVLDYIDDNYKNKFKNRFIYDIFKSGISVIYAEYSSRKKLKKINHKLFTSYISKAKKIINSKQNYLDYEWYSQEYSGIDMFMWYFGASLIKKLGNRNYLEISEKDIIDFIKSY